MSTAAEERSKRIEDLVGRLEKIEDRESRQIAQDLMAAILELHGAGLDRIMDIVFEAGEPGKAIMRKFVNDDLVASLLVLHGLHPDDMETRIQQALAKSDASAELLGILDGVVRVRVTAEGCGARALVETAIREAAPDAVSFVIEEHALSGGFVPLEALYMDAPKVS
jgi:hypothetical protein